MFTIKLRKVHDIKIISGRDIDISPAACPPGTPEEEMKGVKEIFVRGIGGTADGPQEAFYVADPRKPRPSGWPDEVVFYDTVFIENQHGATTEVVRSY